MHVDILFLHSWHFILAMNHIYRHICLSNEQSLNHVQAIWGCRFCSSASKQLKCVNLDPSFSLHSREVPAKFWFRNPLKIDNSPFLAMHMYIIVKTNGYFNQWIAGPDRKAKVYIMIYHQWFIIMIDHYEFVHFIRWIGQRLVRTWWRLWLQESPGRFPEKISVYNFFVLFSFLFFEENITIYVLKWQRERQFQ